MTITDLPLVFREAFAVHRIFAVAGIPYADIYVLPEALDQATGEIQMAVQAQQGDLTFTVTVGKINMPVEKFAARWTEVTAFVKSLTSEEFQAMTDATQMRGRAEEIFMGMINKGFAALSGGGSCAWMN